MVLGDFVSNEMKEIIFYIFLGVTMSIILPIGVGFGLLGFEESFAGDVLRISDALGTFLVYYIFIVASFTLIIFPIGRIVAIREKEHPATQPNPSFFRVFTVSFIFAPEENGALYNLFSGLGFSEEKNPMRWSLSIIRVMVIAIIIFWGLGILQSAGGLSFTSVPDFGFGTQQVTKISSFVFAIEPPSWSETMTMLFIFSFLMGVVAYLTSKFLKDRNLQLLMFFTIGFLIICPLIGLGWMSFHSIVYGNSSASLFATFLFGWIGASLTLLTGTFLFWYLWHIGNNGFIELQDIFVATREDLFLFAIIGWISLIILYVSVEILIFRFKKRRQQGVVPSI